MSVHKNKVECFYLQRWTTSVTIAILLNLFFKFRVLNVNSEKQGWMFLFVAINNIHHDCNRVVSSVQLWRNRDIKDGVCSDVTA